MTDPSRLSDEALLVQGEWLRVTLSSIGDGVITTDAEGRVGFLNSVAASLTGWTLQEAVGQPLDNVFRILSEDDHQPVDSPAVRVLREGSTIKLTRASLLVAKDGTERPLMDTAAPIRNEEGRVVGVVVVFQDISARREAERAVDKALAYANDIIETLREGFLVLDGDLRVRKANRSFYDLFQVPAGQTENQLVYELGNGQWNIPRLRTVLDEVLTRRRPVYDYKVEHAFPTLGRRVMLLNARQFPPDAVHPDFILLAIQDITTAQAQADELAEASRRKDEFLATLAHELRNPLAPVRNALQILRLKSGDSQAVQSASEMMERQIGQMVRLVDDLLDVGRISRGKVELRKVRVELASAVHHAVEAARPLYDSMSHELVVTLQPPPIFLNADPTRLTQVVGNLVNNACKFTDKGGRIFLTVQREGGQAVIRVRDNGIGIAADQLPRIFDMFTQVDTTLERSVSGLGIGLTLVKNLVEMHGGTVEAHSAGVGHGSEFVVRLPMLLDTPKPPSQPTASEPTTITPSRILVVDDNRDSATSLAELLKLTGNETHTAFDGLEAVEVAAAFKPDVVLLDIGLPKLNGYEAARKIREEPWGKDMVLVALTGWGQEEDRQKSKEAGFDGHMVKPVDYAALMKLLAELKTTTG